MNKSYDFIYMNVIIYGRFQAFLAKVGLRLAEILAKVSTEGKRPDLIPVIRSFCHVISLY